MPGSRKSFTLIFWSNSRLTIISVLANILWCAKVNRDKKRGKYDQYAGCGDDRDPEFEMIL